MRAAVIRAIYGPPFIGRAARINANYGTQLSKSRLSRGAHICRRRRGAHLRKPRRARWAPLISGAIRVNWDIQRGPVDACQGNRLATSPDERSGNESNVMACTMCGITRALLRESRTTAIVKKCSSYRALTAGFCSVSFPTHLSSDALVEWWKCKNQTGHGIGCPR